MNNIFFIKKQLSKGNSLATKYSNTFSPMADELFSSTKNSTLFLTSDKASIHCLPRLHLPSENEYSRVFFSILKEVEIRRRQIWASVERSQVSKSQELRACGMLSKSVVGIVSFSESRSNDTFSKLK